MRITALIPLYAIPVLLVCFFHGSAEGIDAEVFPPAINQGDAFTVKVSGVNPAGLPMAELSGKQLSFSSCGEDCFLALGSVSIDTQSGDHIIRLNIGDQEINLSLAVKQAAFPERHLTLPDEKVFLNPEDLKRAQAEAAKLKSLWPVVTDKVWEGNFILPLENSISTAFGTKRIINKKKNSIHRGIDIRGKKGEKVNATNTGRVVLAEELFFGGNTLILDHGQGIYSLYMHLSAFNVAVDDIVAKGSVIGFVGSTGRSTGPHLHFGVKVLNVNTNPISLAELEL
ncbi:MAG: M23 family metallopeptidase [Nitrospiraceae bacterium]|nr:MAG: M23 family metallopeptidase [Nitrospiraceae bacterium]